MGKKLCSLLVFDKVGQRLLGRQFIGMHEPWKLHYLLVSPLAQQGRKELSCFGVLNEDSKHVAKWRKRWSV